MSKLLTLVIVVLCIGGLWYFFNVELVKWKAEKAAEAEAAHWAELRKAVIIAGTPLLESPQSSTMDYGAQSTRLLEFYKNRSLDFDDTELSKAWNQIEATSSSGIQILDEIGYVDRVKPNGYEILASAAQNDDDGNHKMWDEIVHRGASELEISDLKKQFRETETKLNDSVGTLQVFAERLSKNEVPNAISVNYLPSWDGTYTADGLEVRNTSSGALDDAIVMVTVRMNSGGSRVHVHYVDRWPAGATLKAIYPYWRTDYAVPETAGDPSDIQVAVYRPSGTYKGDYALTPEMWEKIISQYCSSLTFSGHYLAPDPNSPNPQEDNHGGFKFQYQGLPTLPVTSVDVRFTSDTDSTVRDYVWTPSASERLTSDAEYPLRSGSLDGATPGHIDLTFSFAETNYTERIHIY